MGDLRAKRDAVSTRLFLEQEFLQQQEIASKATAEKQYSHYQQGDDEGEEVEQQLPCPGAGWTELPPLPAAALLGQRPERGDLSSGGSSRSHSSRERDVGGTGSRQRVVSVFRTPSALTSSALGRSNRGGFNVAQAMGRGAAGGDSAAAAVGALLRERQVKNILH